MISNPRAPNDTWKATELRKLPPSERDAILLEAAAKAEQAYLTNPALSGFDAFGEDDLHGTSSAAPTG
jgi:hypothetical protein